MLVVLAKRRMQGRHEENAACIVSDQENIVVVVEDVSSWSEDLASTRGWSWTRKHLIVTRQQPCRR